MHSKALRSPEIVTMLRTVDVMHRSPLGEAAGCALRIRFTWPIFFFSSLPLRERVSASRSRDDRDLQRSRKRLAASLSCRSIMLFIYEGTLSLRRQRFTCEYLEVFERYIWVNNSHSNRARLKRIARMKKK